MMQKYQALNSEFINNSDLAKNIAALATKAELKADLQNDGSQYYLVPQPICRLFEKAGLFI